MSEWKTPDPVSGNDKDAGPPADSPEHWPADRSPDPGDRDGRGLDGDARAVLEASGIGLLIVGRDGRIVEATQAVRELITAPVTDDRLLDALSARLNDGYDLADHIAEGYEKKGVSEKEAERRAWATVNKDDGGGKKPGGSGRGKSTGHPAAHKGGKKGGEASANRSAAERSASAKKAAATRKRNAEHHAH